MSATISPESSTVDHLKPNDRRRIWVWLKRGMLGLVATLAGLSLVGIVFQTIGSMRDARRFPTTGQMVDAGGYRLHMIVAGSSHPGPTVILDAGLGFPSTYLARLQEQVAPFARVVTYDRPGIGWSDPPPEGQTQDSLSTARALHTALINAGIPGPFVLVGHSAGGLNMLVFADTFPQETSGIVLVDSTHPDQFLRYPPEQAQGEKTMARMSMMFEWGARLGILRLMNGPRMLEAEELPDDQKDALQAYFASPRFGSGIAAELGAFNDLSFPQVRAIQSLGTVPLIVLTAGQTAEQVPVQVEMHKEYASLSANSLHRTITGASHGNLVVNSKYLPEVTSAVRQVFEAARDGASLQP